MTPAPSIPAAPRTVFIELTNRCNMHCTFCPSDLLRRGRENQDDARLRAFLDQLHALGMRPPILLNVLGEPLLNKRVFEYLDLFEREGHLVTLITNMTRLADKSVQRELLKHANLTLALSLQTATAKSYRMRGYPQMKFREFYGLIDQVVEEKFRMGSGTRLEIHVASNYVVGRDPTIQSDVPLRLWPNFPSEGAERRWIARTLRRLEAFGRRARKRYSVAFDAEKARAALLYKDHIGSRIAVSRQTLPPDFFHLKDEVFWGYMFLPNVFLVFKSFELWTRDEAFLRGVLPPDTFSYVEENPGPWSCPMTESFGLLANGDYVSCCLDYEGEMGLGNIDTASVASVLGSERRASIRADAMGEPVCRRCKGNLFVFATKPLSAAEQQVDKFGRGWWPHEPGLHGKGGRWTQGEAVSYVFARIPALALKMSFLSALDPAAPLSLKIESYQPDSRTFRPEKEVRFFARKDEPGEFLLDFDFEPGRFYRLTLNSPAFVPDETLHNGDTRRLGLAVFDIRLLARRA